MQNLPDQLRFAFAFAIFLGGTSSLLAQRVEKIDVSSGTQTGKKERGPVKIKAVNINPIRYHYSFDSTTTFSAPVDLFGGLTTQSTQPAPVPNPSPAGSAAIPKSAASGTLATNQDTLSMVARKKRAASVSAPDVDWEAIVALTKKATAAGTTFQAADIEYNSQLKSYSDPLEAFSKESIDLASAQNLANIATSLVNQATGQLKIYLTSDYGTKPAFFDNLITETSRQLAVGSTFMKGTEATWPTQVGSDDIVTFQDKLAKTAKALNDASAKAPAFSAQELPVLQSSQQTMSALLTQIEAAATNYAKSHDIKPHQSDIDAATVPLTKDIALAKADIDSLNSLSARLTTAIQQSSLAATNSAALAQSSTAYSSFITARDALAWWGNRMSSVQKRFQAHPAESDPENPFAISVKVDCHFTFSTTKDTTVTLNAIDLSQPSASQKPTPVFSLIVECTSPFSISAGVAFSTIPDAQYSITPDPTSTSTTPVNDITQTSTSRFHPLPLALINYRFSELKNEKVAFYTSFGVATNIRSQNNGGSSAEYLIGPSIGFARTFFITMGAHLGTQPSVSAPYSVGYKNVPSTLTTVPVSTNYTAGFGLGITFTKP
jgi:hypothetical protein